MLGECDYCGNRASIRSEIGDSGQAQQQRVTLDLCPRQRQLIDVVRPLAREGAGGQIECDLDRTRAITIETLDQDGSRSQEQHLREAKLQYSQQDEQEVHRHGAGDSGQTDLEPRRKNPDQQVTDELRDVSARGFDGSVRENTRARQDDKADEYLGAYAQFSP